MNEMGLGAGLGALGFWLFIAAVVVAGIWYDVRKRQIQHETLQQIIASGQSLDADMVDRIMAAGASGSDVERDLRISGYITAFIAPGLAIMAWFMGQISPNALSALLGVAALVGFISVGLLAAARVAKNWKHRSLAED